MFVNKTAIPIHEAADYLPVKVLASGKYEGYFFIRAIARHQVDSHHCVIGEEFYWSAIALTL